MNRFCVLIISLICLSCQKKKKTTYQGIDRNYYVSNDISEKNGSLDTLYTFSLTNSAAKIYKIGFYKNGFMNGTWTYNTDSGIKDIKWAHYYDENLKFETNVFTFVDSVKHGKNYSKFRFNNGKSTLLLTISLNGSIKDSIPEKNYDKITKNELLAMNAEIAYYESKDVLNRNQKYHVIHSKITLPNKTLRYINAMYCYMSMGLLLKFLLIQLLNAIFTRMSYLAALYLIFL